MGQGPEHRRAISPARLLQICLFAILFGLIPILYVNLSISVLDDLGSKEWGGADFTAYYTAARLIVEGKSPYDATARVQEAQSLGLRTDRPYVYPPLLAIAMIPLAVLPPQAATLVWFWISVALLVLSTVLVIRMLELHNNRIYVMALLVVALSFYPAIFSSFMGQVNSLLLCLVVLTWHLARRGRETLAGTTLALASLIKIFPFCIALYFLWKGKYRVFLYTLAAFIILIGISIAVVGPEPHWTYVNSVLPTKFLISHPFNQSLFGFIARIVERDDGNSLALWRVWSLSASILLALATVLLVSPGGKHEEASGLEMSLVIVAALLISTATYLATLTLLLIPYAVLTRHFMDKPLKQRRWPLSLAVSSFVLVNSQRFLELSVRLSDRGSVTSPWLLGLPMYGMLILWLTIAYILLRHRRVSAPPGMRR